MDTAAVLTGIRKGNPRYTEAAYLFLLSALQRRLSSLELPRHISGAEVADALIADDGTCYGGSPSGGGGGRR